MKEFQTANCEGSDTDWSPAIKTKRPSSTIGLKLATVTSLRFSNWKIVQRLIRKYVYKTPKALCRSETLGITGQSKSCCSNGTAAPLRSSWVHGPCAEWLWSVKAEASVQVCSTICQSLVKNFWKKHLEKKTENIWKWIFQIFPSLFVWQIPDNGYPDVLPTLAKSRARRCNEPMAHAAQASGSGVMWAIIWPCIFRFPSFSSGFLTALARLLEKVVHIPSGIASKTCQRFQRHVSPVHVEANSAPRSCKPHVVHLVLGLLQGWDSSGTR